MEVLFFYVGTAQNFSAGKYYAQKLCNYSNAFLLLNNAKHCLIAVCPKGGQLEVKVINHGFNGFRKALNNRTFFFQALRGTQR